MEELIVFIPFLFLLFYLQVTQGAYLPPPTKVGQFCGSKLSVKQIFTHNHNWDRYCLIHGGEIRAVKREVEKMMSCKGPDRGYFVYQCPKCGEIIEKSLGCNSRLCSDCDKRYTDQWAKTLSRKMFNMPHRHAVMTLPDKLRPVLKEDRKLWKVVMDPAIKALNDILSYAVRKEVLAGAIIVLHPFGRDLGFNLHIHLLSTEGGFDKSEKFIHKTIIHYNALRRTWQYQERSARNTRKVGIWY